MICVIQRYREGERKRIKYKKVEDNNLLSTLIYLSSESNRPTHATFIFFQVAAEW